MAKNLSNPPTTPPHMPSPAAKKTLSPQLVIVGGDGAMGQLMARIFRRYTKAKISSLDKKAKHPLYSAATLTQAASKADILILAVPMGETTLDLIAKILPHMRKNSLFMDITSLKQAETQAMIKYSPPEIELLGTHPLFGPYHDIKGQIMALTPIHAVRAAHKAKWLPYIEKTFKKAGLITVILSPQEHDQAMSIVQVLLHVILYSLVGTAQQLTQRWQQDMTLPHTLSTPIYKLTWLLASRILGHDHQLYRNIAFRNAYSKEALHTFRQVLSTFVTTIETGNVEAFNKQFTTLKAFAHKSYPAACPHQDIASESQKLINFLSQECALLYPPQQPSALPAHKKLKINRKKST